MTEITFNHLILHCLFYKLQLQPKIFLLNFISAAIIPIYLSNIPNYIIIIIIIQ